MGKNTGGVTDWHKQQHKKQLAKSKEARIAARDERVVQEKTVSEVRAEIRTLEQHYKVEQQRPHHIQSKLDRLNKELKLVTTKEEADKQQRELTLQQQKTIRKHESNVKFVPLERPEVSVYYDAVMNPFGAPPPGQPRLYFRRQGGTTMDLNEACSPQEQFLPPPPPPPPPPAVQTHPPQQRNQSIPQLPPSQDNTRRNSNHFKATTCGNKPSEDNIESKAKNQQSTNTQSTTGVVVVDPTQLPALPTPSAAVARSKRNRLTTDIWASMEEIKYEEIVSSTSLEGVASSSSSNLLVAHSIWFYKDMTGVVQGPYTTDHMRQWNIAGYFPKTTPVAGTSSSGSWRPLLDIKQLNGNDEEVDVDKQHNIKNRSSSSVQDRIAALRDGTKTAPSNSEALLPTIPARSYDDVNRGSDDESENSVQGRIAAFKSQQCNVDKVQEGLNHKHDDDTLQDIDSDLVPNDNNEENVEAMSVQNRIAALRAQHVPAVTEGIVEMRDRDDVEIDPQKLPLPPPPLPLPNGAMPSGGFPMYPVGDDIAPYLIDQDSMNNEEEVDNPNREEIDEVYDVSYPANDDAYPVTGDYADDEYADDDTEYYPVTDPYEYANTVIESKEVEQPKKKIKVDQAVVALIPSRLRKRQQR